MFEFLFENAFVLIPIAIFIGLRAVEARRKREAEEERQRRIKEAVYEQDDDEDEEEYGGSCEEDGDDNKKSAPPFPPAAAAAPKLAPEPAASFAGAYTVPALMETAGKQDVSRRAGKAAGGFGERLDYLPPLKRAMVMAEILKPPKGFG